MITVNGTNLSAYGFRYRGRRLPGMGGRRATTSPVPGGVPVLLGRTIEPGTLQVDGWFKGATHAELLSRRDSLVGLLQGQCVLRFADITDREWVGYLDPASRDDALGAAEITTGHAASLSFVLPDPAARAQSATVTAGTNPTVTLGTAPSFPVITVTNGASGTITQVIIRARAGTTVLSTLQWQGSIGAADALVVDCTRHTVARLGSVNAIDGLTAASEFPVLDPQAGATNLQLVITGGSGVVVSTSYRRRWW